MLVPKARVELIDPMAGVAWECRKLQPASCLVEVTVLACCRSMKELVLGLKFFWLHSCCSS